MDKDLSKVKRDLRKLLRSQPLAVLATQNQGQPYASLVAFASSDDLKSLYFATTRSTRKYANLSGDSRVAMLVDNRSNKASDFRWAMAATATGTAKEVDPAREGARTGTLPCQTSPSEGFCPFAHLCLLRDPGPDFFRRHPLSERGGGSHQTMKLVLSLHEITRRDRARIGGKGFALAMMQRRGLHVPEALCISTEAYHGVCDINRPAGSDAHGALPQTL